MFLMSMQIMKDIDRGIPIENGRPVERFKDIVFGDSKGDNLTTLEADIFRATLSTVFSDTSKGNLQVVLVNLIRCIKTTMRLVILLEQRL